MSMAATLLKRNKSPQGLVGIFTITASGNYAANGDSLDFAPKIGYTNRQPSSVVITGVAGYVYEYDKANKKVKVRRMAPAGTVAAPIFTGTALGTHVHDILLKGGVTATEPVAVSAGDTLGKNAATDRTIVGANSASKGGVVAITGGTPTGVCSAPAFTGTAAALTELTAGAYPAGVTGDTITATATWAV